MPNQLSKGHTFHDGDTGVSAATLNSIVDSATILPGAISEQPSAPPSTGDSFLYKDNENGVLRRCTLTQILNQVPANSPSNTASLRKLGTGSQMAAAGNDSRLPKNQTGIRMGNGAGSADTVAAPQDTLFAPVALAHNDEIDWDAANLFYRTCTGAEAFTFANVRAGRSITVILKTNNHAVTFPPLVGDDIVIPGGIGQDVCHVHFFRTALGTTGYVVAGG